MVKRPVTMANSRSAAPVARLLAELSPERRREVRRVRALIRRHLPKGYEETATKGLLVYQVPWDQYSDTYNGQPLWYVALGCTKSGLSLHLLPVYGSPALRRRLEEGFRRAGKRLDLGKACLRFKTADDLAADVIGDIVGSLDAASWIAMAKAARRHQ